MFGKIITIILFCLSANAGILSFYKKTIKTLQYDKTYKL